MNDQPNAYQSPQTLSNRGEPLATFRGNWRQFIPAVMIGVPACLGLLIFIGYIRREFNLSLNPIVLNTLNGATIGAAGGIAGGMIGLWVTKVEIFADAIHKKSLHSETIKFADVHGMQVTPATTGLFGKPRTVILHLNKSKKFRLTEKDVQDGSRAVAMLIQRLEEHQAPVID